MLYAARDADGQYALFLGKPTWNGAEWDDDREDCRWMMTFDTEEIWKELFVKTLKLGECKAIRRMPIEWE